LTQKRTIEEKGDNVPDRRGKGKVQQVAKKDENEAPTNSTQDLKTFCSFLEL